jgi:hypothetical protein
MLLNPLPLFQTIETDVSGLEEVKVNRHEAIAHEEADVRIGVLVPPSTNHGNIVGR